MEEVSVEHERFAAHLAAKRARRIQHARFAVGIAVGTATLSLITDSPRLGFRLAIILGIIYVACVVIENTFVSPRA